jgi:acetyl-CoA carboxylase carboxyltransferase component
MNMAATLEIDAVIDPADTLDWLVRGSTRQCGARRPARASWIPGQSRSSFVR